MTEQTDSKMPQIRFKGFEAEWVEKKLGDAMANVSNNTLSRANLNYRSGLARNVHYGDILVRFGEVLDVQSDGVPFISEDAVAIKLKSSNLKNGDIVIADAAEDEMVGKCTEIQNVGDQIILAGLHTIALRPLTRFAPFYLGYYLNSDAFHDQLLPIMQGTKVLSISKTAIKQTAICFPAHKAEQQKIGEYFREMDCLIGLHQRKHDKLVTLKKAMLQKMFPQPGATTPEIRFKDFSGDWVEKKLGSVSESYSGGTPSVGNRSYYGGDIPFVRSAEINATSMELTITELGLRNSSAKMISKGQVLYALYGATSGEVGISQINGAINQAILAIRPHAGYSSEFIAIWLRNKKAFIVGTYLQGGQGNLSGNIVKSLEVDFPSSEEQQKIGTYFRTLDALISQHAIQLQKLKQIKSACLEKMFV